MELDMNIILPTEMMFQILGFVENYEDLLSTILEKVVKFRLIKTQINVYARCKERYVYVQDELEKENWVRTRALIDLLPTKFVSTKSQVKCNNDTIDTSFVDEVTLVADRPVFEKVAFELLSGVYYYEITIDHLTEYGLNQCVGVGIVESDFEKESYIGWVYSKKSISYDGDDGISRKNDSAYITSAYIYGPKFGVGDTIGVGIDYRHRAVFFTKNGQFLNVAYTGLEDIPWFPAAAILRTGTKWRANFGKTPFQYGIQEYVQKYIMEAPPLAHQ